MLSLTKEKANFAKHFEKYIYFGNSQKKKM